MGNGQGTYNYEDEGKIFGMSVGDVVTKSNGHGEGKEGSINLIETIKIMPRDVKSYKTNNERLMKAKEQQDDFNTKMLQSLNRIEKKMDKETDSSESRSRRSNAERKESRSVSRHHHHSPRNSTRRAYNSLSISLVTKHKRRYGVDELQGEMNTIKPPIFDGEHKKDDDAKTWLLGLRKYF
jgi:hypothetical protein